jgi:TolA-binding protein
LEELNPYPSKSEAELLDMLRAAGVEQIYFVNQFRDIMARAKAQIEAGQFLQAINTYLEGFGINKDRFDEAGYGNILVNSVNTALGNMRQSINDFRARSAALKQENPLIGAEAEALGQVTAAVAAALESMTANKGTVDRAGLTFQVLNTQIRDNSANDQYDLFLFFAGQLVFGPGDSTTEGIAYAMDAIWWQDSAGLQSPLLQRGQTAYAAAVEGFRTRSLDRASESIVDAQALFTALLDLQALWPLRVAPTRDFPLDESARIAVDAALPAFLRTQEYLKALSDYRSLVDTSQRTAVLQEKEVTTTAQIFEDRKELVELIRQTTVLGSGWQQQLAFYTDGAGVGYSLNDHAAQAREVISDIDGTLAAIEALDIRLLDRVARVQGVEFEERFQRYKDSFEEGVRLQEGMEVTLDPIRDEEGQIVEMPVRVEQFPARAVAVFQPLVTDLEDLAGGAAGMLEDTLRNRDYLDRSGELQIHVRSLESLVERTAQLQEELATRLEDARQAALQAERYRREGLLRYQQAQSNVNSERYAEARQNIQTAREAFDNSLSFQEDPEVRRIRDDDLVALSRSIIDRENDRVIREVRGLIDSGRRFYSQGDFSGAEQTLLKAQARWGDTNPAENPEVSFWLALVRSAVDATTGREIAVTDPLYKEMSQLYNLAYGDFQAGRKAVEQGETGVALRLLQRAEERIAKILVPFPYNARARVLTLRILQISDPDAFRRRITELYNDALARRNESPQEAYAVFKDIEQIQPQYPGLQTAIRNIEITLGLRIPPPDPAKITESRDLYLQAKSIRDRNLRDLYPVALDQLNEAIRLNPDNRDAVALKDQLLIVTGGEREDVLSSDDQRLLREAEAKYLSGRYFEALAIIEQLLRKPSNQKNRELLDLEKRVRAKTG